MRYGCLILAIVNAAGGLPVIAAEPPGFRTLAIGDAAPDFKLPGVDGREYSLASFANARLLLVIFTCNHCPTAQAYEGRIKQLHADYKDRGVALVAISPNDPQAVRLDELGYTDVGDSLAEMQLRAKDQQFEFPYLYDGETQQTSLAYGALATPHVFLFDQERRLRYTGRIDDSDVKTVTSHDTRNALEALLAGQPVPVATTRVFGCSTKWSDKRSQAAESLAKWSAEPVTLKKLDEAGLRTLAKNDTENYVLVNLWASWCVPCITELPEFVTMNRMYRKRNFQLVTISIDDPADEAKALRHLQQQQVAATNYLSTVATTDRLAELLDPEWPGPVPYTLLIAPGGQIVFRDVNAIDPLEVRRAIVQHLGRTYANRR